MHFFKLSHVELIFAAFIYSFVIVVSQENLGQLPKIMDAVGTTSEMKVTEIPSVIDNVTDKVTTEVPLVFSPSSQKTSTQKTVTSATKIVTVATIDSVKTPNCILLDLDGTLSFKDLRKTDIWSSYYFNSSEESEFHGCPINEDIKKPIVFGLLMSNIALNFTAKQRTDNSGWYIGSISVTYNPAEVFKDKTFEKFDEIKTSSDEYFMETPMDKSFACSEPRTIALYNKRGKLAARIVLKSIQMQIYNVPKDGKYSPESQCGENLAQPVPTDSQDTAFRSDTVPVVVGSCLAVITVLVVAGYAIYRSLTVKKLDYATMEE